MRSSLVVLALVAALSVPLAAKPHSDAEPAQFSEQIEVRLVEVDLWAEKDGRPVLDLGQSELALEEDGRPVDIFYFAQPTAEGGGVGPSTGGGAEGTTLRTLVAVFFDDAHLELAHRQRAASAVADLLGRGLGQVTDLVLVRADRDVEVVVPRTGDRSRLTAALASFAQPGTGAIEAAFDEQKTLEAIRERQRAGIEANRNGLSERAQGAGEESPEGSFDFPCPTELLRLADGLADRERIRATQTLQMLARFSAALAAAPGRRILVFVSDGLPTRPGAAAYDYVRALCDGSGAQAGLQYAVDISGVGRSRQMPGQLTSGALATAGEGRNLTNEIERAIAQANSSGVVVWTIGARGLSPSGSGAGTEIRTSVAGSESRRQGELEDTMVALASATGGRSILQRNDFDVALGELDEDLRSSYSLAFSSPRSGDGRVHRLKLTTTRPGVRLRYRQSWRDTTAADDLLAAVNGALRYGIDRPGLGARAALMRRPGESPGAGLVLRLLIPQQALVALPGDDHAFHARLRMALTLQGAGSDPTPVRTTLIPVDFPARRPEGEPPPLVRDIGLPPMALPALVVVGLRDELGGGIAILRLEAPATGP